MEMPLGARIGTLTLMGAVEWRADRPDFGGFSGLMIEPDGTLIALTDKAHWAKARIVLTPEGALRGIEGLEVGRLKGPEGTDLMDPFTDSEALSREANGSFLISFENRHRIGRFTTLRTPEERFASFPGFDEMPLNGGLESLLALPDGRIVAVAEETPDWAAGFPGWILADGEIVRFALVRKDWFVPTDLALGPQGRWIYLLERRFTLIGGFGTRISRFPVAALREGARIEAMHLAELTRHPLKENFEGISASQDARGRVVLYIISDDNFTLLQRTLLLQLLVENGKDG